MKKIREVVREVIRDVLGEVTTDNNLTLYHGSGSREIFDMFYDNQFFTVNDYIASNYAYNFGGLMYKVKVDLLNPFELKGYDRTRDESKYYEMVGLLKELYDEDVAHNYERMYFTPSPSTTFGKYGWKPIVEWAKKNGYDSLKFVDESFDTFVRGISYLIFDGGKPKILDVYEVEDAVESNNSNYKKVN